MMGRCTVQTMTMGQATAGVNGDGMTVPDGYGWENDGTVCQVQG